MDAIVCGQLSVLGDACPSCGGWLHRVMRGGFAGPDDAHYGTRDLLCACEICAAHGLPTQAMLAEWAEYVRSLPDPTRQTPNTGGILSS